MSSPMQLAARSAVHRDQPLIVAPSSTQRAPRRRVGALWPWRHLCDMCAVVILAWPRRYNVLSGRR